MDPNPMYCLRPPDEKIVTAISFHSSNLNTLAAGNNVGGASIWCLRRRRPILNFAGRNTKPVLWIGIDKFTADDSEPTLLWTKDKSGLISGWDINLKSETADPTFSMDFNSEGFGNASFINAGVLAVAVGQDVSIICTKSRKIIASLKQTELASMCMCIARLSDAQLVAGYENGTVALWDIAKRQVISLLSLSNEPIMALDYHAASRCGLSTFSDEKISLWTSTGHSKLQLQENLTMTSSGAGCVKFRDDGKIFAVGQWNGRLRLYAGRKQLVMSTFHKKSITCTTFSRSNLLAASSRDGTISLWNMFADKGS